MHPVHLDSGSSTARPACRFRYCVLGAKMKASQVCETKRIFILLAKISYLQGSFQLYNHELYSGHIRSPSVSCFFMSLGTVHIVISRPNLIHSYSFARVFLCELVLFNSKQSAKIEISANPISMGPLKTHDLCL